MVLRISNLQIVNVIRVNSDIYDLHLSSEINSQKI